MKQNNKRKLNKSKLLLFTAPIFTAPIFSLISCQNEEAKEKDALQKELANLKTKIEELKTEDSNYKSSNVYNESIKIITDIEAVLKKENITLIELRKFKNQAKNAITSVQEEINKIKRIKEENAPEEKPETNLNYSDEEFARDFSEITKAFKLEDKFDISFEHFFSGNRKEDIYPSELQKAPTSIKVSPKDKSLEEKIIFSVETVFLDDDANQSGKAKINIVFKNKATLKRLNHLFKIDGFKTSFDNLDRNGDKPNNKFSENIKNSEINKYISLDQNQRFKYDNDKYVDGIKSYLALSAGIPDWKNFRENIKATDDQIRKHDEKASQVGQDSFINSAYKGFTIPSFKENGDVAGLEILESAEFGKKESWVDTLGKNDPYKATGLARTIVNEHYLEIAKQTFSIGFTYLNDFKDDIAKLQNSINHWENPNNAGEYRNSIDKKIKELEEAKAEVEEDWNKRIEENEDEHLAQSLQTEKEKALKRYDDAIADYRQRTIEKEIELLKEKIREFEKRAGQKRERLSENGTAWIMDFEINENGYPTKWYLGTNSHVARAMINNLTSFSLTKIDNNLSVGSKLRVSELDNNITRFSFENPGAIKKVFDGIDYLKTSPKDFLTERQKANYQDLEEFVDFAVLEIDFTKIDKFFATSNDQSTTNNYPQSNQEKFAEKLAKEITNDYANQQSKHIKFKKNSYLNNYDSINYPLKGELPSNLDQLYALGWPSSKADYFLEIPNKETNEDQIARKSSSFSLWTNSEYEYFNAKITDGENGPSSYPKDKLDRGNFLSYQIGYRSFKDKPGVLDTFISIPKLGQDFYYVDGKRYVNMALAYMPRRWAPIGGSSGSSIRNQNNELVSVYYATNTSAIAGLSAAFRSEGFDYKGLYGKYNLPQYDLIYGGGREQKNSYREALKKLYESTNIKTNLFKNGLDEIPNEFKFNN